MALRKVNQMKTEKEKSLRERNSLKVITNIRNLL